MGSSSQVIRIAGSNVRLNMHLKICTLPTIIFCRPFLILSDPSHPFYPEGVTFCSGILELLSLLTIVQKYQ